MWIIENLLRVDNNSQLQQPTRPGNAWESDQVRAMHASLFKMGLMSGLDLVSQKAFDLFFLILFFN
jgi:hypothetical protein